VKEAAIRAIREDFSHYTANAGIPDLIAAIRAKFARENGLEFDSSQILVSTGAKQSIFNALLAICDPGDEVVVPAPYWVSYPPMVKIADATPVIVRTTGETGYKLTPELLRKALSGRSKALILNSPSNPTGAVYTAAELRGLAEVAARAGIYVISDEIYEKLLYDRARHVSIGSFDSVREKVVTVNGVSKAFAMTGWRIGYMGGPRDVIASAAKVQSQSTSNANSIAQRAALAALTGPDAEVASMVREFERRRDYLVGRLRMMPGVSIDLPTGGFCLFPDFTGCVGARTAAGAVMDDTSLAAYLLEEAKVAVVPGSAFGMENHLRLSYACSMGDIEDACNRMESALAKLLED
jgi:aspartate aminotransferase